jgi:hypothetical protein
MRSWVLGAGVAFGTLWAGLSAQAQMDDVTMPGGEKKAPPAVLTESEFKEWAAKPGAVVFDLQYKGLTDKEIGQITIFSTFESQTPETPFTQSVGLAKDKCVHFQIPLLRGSDEGLLEYEGENAKALYLDLDCDGKLGKGEKLKPIKKQNNVFFYFVTPDFTATRTDGKKVPFRLLARADFMNSCPQVLFSSFFLWEGKTKLGDAQVSLCLRDGNSDGSYGEFGQDLIRLVKTSELDKGFIFPYTLSSVTCLDQVFYQLRFTGEGTKEKPLRAVLCKDTSPTGKLEIKTVGIAAEPKSQGGRLISTETPTILFDIRDCVAIPEGRYRLTQGNLAFGKDGTSSIGFEKGPECRIVAGQTVTIELGQPKLKVLALEAAKRYVTPVEAKSSFSAGTNVYLDLKLVGKQGEEYGSSFFEQSEKGEYVPPAKPHLQILGPDGQEVVSSDLEFG